MRFSHVTNIDILGLRKQPKLELKKGTLHIHLMHYTKICPVHATKRILSTIDYQNVLLDLYI